MVCYDVEAFLVRLIPMVREKRLQHSIQVMETSEKLARMFGADVEKAKIAGLLHDCARDMSKESLLAYAKENDIVINEVCAVQPELLHGVVGADLAQKQFEILDQDILNAIIFHTTGRESMSLLEKIVYVADCIEPLRKYEGVDKLRGLVKQGLDAVMICALSQTMQNVLDKDGLLHIDTIKARNDFLIKKRR